MNEVIKKELRKNEFHYLDGIQNLQKKHMNLLSDLIQRPTLGGEITEITIKKDTLLNGDLIYTEIDPPIRKKFEKNFKEKKTMSEF